MSLGDSLISISGTLSCVCPAQKYDFIEFFAGKAWVSRIMKYKGYSVAALDIMYGEDVPHGKQNAMDLLTDAGFAFLGATSFFF